MYICYDIIWNIIFLRDLVHLNLGKNSLSTIAPTWLSPLLTLKTLDLSQVILDHHRELLQALFLVLSDHHFVCSCRHFSSIHSRVNHSADDWSKCLIILIMTPMSKIFGQHLKIGLFQNLILRLEIASESLTEVDVNNITTININILSYSHININNIFDRGGC